MKRSVLLALLNKLDFTPTERRILSLLCDGEQHDITEVLQKAYPSDELASRQNLASHVTGIRNKVRHLDHTVLSEYIGGITYYRYVIYSTIVDG